MKRLLRTLLAAVGILALVMVGAVVYVTTFFDPDDLKPRLIDVVQEQSGLELTLEGPLSWSFYPRLGVSVEKVEAWLPDQAIEEEPAFAAFRRAEVSLAFAPLLRGEIAVDGLTLNGLQLNLERDDQGVGNWEALLDRLVERREMAEGALAPASAGPSPALADAGNLSVVLNIASVQLREADVRFRDHQAGQEFRLEGLSMTGTNVNPSRPFPLTSSFRFVAQAPLDGQDSAPESPPQWVSDVTLESRVNLRLAERRYTLESLVLDTTSRLADLEGEQSLKLQGGRLLIDAGEKRLQLEEGKLDVTLRHPSLGGSPLPLSLAFQLDADLVAQTAQWRDLELTGENGLRLSGNLSLRRILEAPIYEGQLRLAPLSLRPWLTRFDILPDTASDTAFSDVALTSPLEGDLDSLNLTGLTLVLDGSTFTGTLGAGFDGRRLDADLQGDRLDLDAYLPAAGTNPDAASLWPLLGVDRAHAQASGGLLPVDWLASLDLDGALSLGRLQLANLDFTDVDLALDGGDGRLRLVSFESGFHEGTLAASGEVDLTQSPIRWQLVPRLVRVRTDTLLEALGEDPAPLRGRLTAQGELTSRGNTLPDLKRNLNGRLESRIEEGAILDVNLSRELCTAVATLEGRDMERDWSTDTRFDQAVATFELRDGTLNSDDLLLTIPGIELGGNGQLDLISERFDLRAAVRFVDSAEAACRVNPRLERVDFPVRCEGSLGGNSREWCSFDREAFQGTLVELLREEVGRRAGEEVERLGEESGQELRDTLRGLFN